MTSILKVLALEKLKINKILNYPFIFAIVLIVFYIWKYNYILNA